MATLGRPLKNKARLEHKEAKLREEAGKFYKSNKLVKFNKAKGTGKIFLIIILSHYIIT